MSAALTASQASVSVQCPRQRIDAACRSGALPAADLTPESSRRSWRIRPADLDEWVRRGYPTTA